MKTKKIMQKIIIVLCMAFHSSLVWAQANCEKDQFNRLVCAPYGGWIGKDQFGHVNCAPGNCVSDQFGRSMCSAQLGGAASKNQFGQPICAGGCVLPELRFCTELTR